MATHNRQNRKKRGKGRRTDKQALKQKGKTLRKNKSIELFLVVLLCVLITQTQKNPIACWATLCMYHVRAHNIYHVCSICEICKPCLSPQHLSPCSAGHPCRRQRGLWRMPPSLLRAWPTRGTACGSATSIPKSQSEYLLAQRRCSL